MLFAKQSQEGGREGHLFMANLVRTFAHLKVLIKAIDFDI